MTWPGEGAQSRSARDLYNEGTKLLNIQKFAEAETKFQAALGAQDEAVQDAALYNVAYARFRVGHRFCLKEKRTRRHAEGSAGPRGRRRWQRAIMPSKPPMPRWRRMNWPRW